MRFFLALTIALSALALTNVLAQDIEPLLNIEKTQQLLLDRGYAINSVDGIPGPNTSAAIRRFQSVHGIEATGTLDAETSRALQTAPYLPLNPNLPANTSEHVPAQTSSGDGSGMWLWLVIILGGGWYLRRRSKSGSRAKPEGSPKSLSSSVVKKGAAIDRGLADFKVKAVRTSNSEKTTNSTSSAVRKKKLSGDSCWVRKGQLVDIAGTNIEVGMLYVGSTLWMKQGYKEPENCLINPRLKVARKGSRNQSDGMPYWPSYSDISPSARRTYLNWLATGAKAPDVYIGFVFLYFYGLERRLFLERINDDSKDIIDEIKRLLALYDHNRSIVRYLGDAVSAASLVVGTDSEELPLRKSKQHPWKIPDAIKLRFGRTLMKRPVLMADDLLLLFFNHPESQFRTPARRLEEPFIRLMQVRLSELYPDGLKLRVPKKSLKLEYTSASGTFIADLTDQLEPIPDIGSLRLPITRTQEVADAVMEELDPWSRLLGRNPEAEGALKAAQFIPKPLIDEFGGTEVNDLKLWLEDKLVDGRAQITLADLRLKLRLEQSSDKLTKTNHVRMSATLTNIGWDLVPAYEELVGPLRDDDSVLCAPNGHGDLYMVVSTEFQLALLELAVGAYIAHTDGHFSDAEVGALLGQVEAGDFTEYERVRLELSLHWMADQVPDFSAINRKLKNADQGLKSRLAEIAVAAAGADGVIDPAEVRALEKIYGTLGLEKQDLFSNLHAMSGAEKTGASLRSTTGNAIADGEMDQPISLDPDRIASTLHDTARASSLLAAIFEDEEPDDGEEVLDSVQDVEPKTGFEGLDSEHSQFLSELLERPEWTRIEYERLAGGLKLMPDGALEVINEWSFEVYDEMLIEDDDPLVIATKLIEEARPT